MRMVARILGGLALFIGVASTAIVVTGLHAGDRPTDAALLRLLHDHGAELAQVGDALLRSGSGSKIDLRDHSDLPVTRDQEELAAILQRIHIRLAAYDEELGGVVFAVYDAGISISGAESGLLYRSPGSSLPVRAEQVDDLTRGLETAKARQPSGRAVEALFIRKVDDRWALYLETF